MPRLSLKSTTPEAPPLVSAPATTTLPVWERRLRELLDFRTVYGHVNVPRYWIDNPRLSNWVSNQRRLLRLGLMPEPRRAS